MARVHKTALRLLRCDVLQLLLYLPLNCGKLSLDPRVKVELCAHCLFCGELPKQDVKKLDDAFSTVAELCDFVSVRSLWLRGNCRSLFGSSGGLLDKGAFDLE